MLYYRGWWLDDLILFLLCFKRLRSRVVWVLLRIYIKNLGFRTCVLGPCTAISQRHILCGVHLVLPKTANCPATVIFGVFLSGPGFSSTQPPRTPFCCFNHNLPLSLFCSLDFFFFDIIIFI